MKKEIYFCDDDNNILYAMKLIMHKAPFKGTFFADPVEMISKIEPEAFLQKFGASIDKVDELVKAKTVTISKLMEIQDAISENSEH